MSKYIKIVSKKFILFRLLYRTWLSITLHTFFDADNDLLNKHFEKRS